MKHTIDVLVLEKHSVFKPIRKIYKRISGETDMKETTTFTKTIQKEEVVSVTCNRCGRSEEGEHIEHASDIETWQHYFGYGSTRDSEHHQFELCDKCYNEWISTFKYQPQIDEC